MRTETVFTEPQGALHTMVPQNSSVVCDSPLFDGRGIPGSARLSNGAGGMAFYRDSSVPPSNGIHSAY